MKRIIAFLTLVSTSVVVVYAQSDGEEMLQKIIVEFFSPLYQLTVGIASLYFLYGVLRYIYELNNPEERTNGKSHLLWGTIGLFIIFSVGGILKLFDTVLGGMFSY